MISNIITILLFLYSVVITTKYLSLKSKVNPKKEKINEKDILILHNPKVNNKVDSEAIVHTIPHIPSEKKKIEDIKNIKFTMVLGVILIMSAILIFSTSTWTILPNFIKVCIVLFGSFICLYLSNNYYDKLRFASITFYTLAIIAFTGFILSVGYFKLFGSLFSLDNGYIVQFVMSIAMLGGFHFGNIRYQNTLFIKLNQVIQYLSIYFLSETIFDDQFISMLLVLGYGLYLLTIKIIKQSNKYSTVLHSLLLLIFTTIFYQKFLINIIDYNIICIFNFCFYYFSARLFKVDLCDKYNLILFTYVLFIYNSANDYDLVNIIYGIINFIMFYYLVNRYHESRLKFIHLIFNSYLSIIIITNIISFLTLEFEIGMYVYSVVFGLLLLFTYKIRNEFTRIAEKIYLFLFIVINLYYIVSIGIDALTLISLYIAIVILCLYQRYIIVRILLMILISSIISFTLYVLNMPLSIGLLGLIAQLLSFAWIFIPDKFKYSKHYKLYANFIPYIIFAFTSFNLIFTSLPIEYYFTIIIFNIFYVFTGKQAYGLINLITIPLILDYLSTYHYLASNQLQYINIGLIILMMALGRIYSKSIITTKPFTFNAFTILSIFSLMQYKNTTIIWNTVVYEPLFQFLVLLTIALYFLQYYKRQNHILDIISVIGTTIFLYLAWNAQLFVDISYDYIHEYQMIGIAVIVILAARSLNFKQVTYPLSLISIVYYTFFTIINDHFISNLTLGILLIFIIYYGLKIKEFKWLILGVVALFMEVVVLTKNFWLSISWWVYLLIAGAFLIYIAINQENHRLNSQKIKDNFKFWKK